MTSILTSGHVLGAAFLVATIAFTGGGAAHAQVGNLPYQAGGGAGLSSGARQAIMNARQLNSRPSNLVRDGSGGLLDVSRRGNQALIYSPSTGAFIPGGQPGRGWATGLGTGLGWGLFAGNGGLSNAYGRSNRASDSMMQWISMLSPAIGRMSTEGLAPVSSSATPIDTWIDQES